MNYIYIVPIYEVEQFTRRQTVMNYTCINSKEVTKIKMKVVANKKTRQIKTDHRKTIQKMVKNQEERKTKSGGDKYTSNSKVIHLNLIISVITPNAHALRGRQALGLADNISYFGCPISECMGSMPASGSRPLHSAAAD